MSTPCPGRRHILRFRRVDVGFEELLRRLAEEPQTAQQHLDEDYVKRLEDFRALTDQLGPTHRALISALAPSRQVVSEMSVEAELGVTGSTGSERGIGVELLSAGYHRKYEYSKFASAKVELVVRQVSMPEPTVRENSPQQEGTEHDG